MTRRPPRRKPRRPLQPTRTLGLEPEHRSRIDGRRGCGPLIIDALLTTGGTNTWTA